MKKTFRTLAVMTLLVAAFSSCKKDSNNNTAGSFTYASKTYNTNAGQWFADGSSSGMLMLASSTVTQSGYNGTVDYVNFMFDQGDVPVGTFTFMHDSDNGYDGAKNFYSSTAGIDLVVTNGQPTGGSMLSTITEGTVTIAKNGTSYSITYNLTFEDGTTAVSGKYTGAIQVTKNVD